MFFYNVQLIVSFTNFKSCLTQYDDDLVNDAPFVVRKGDKARAVLGCHWQDDDEKSSRFQKHDFNNQWEMSEFLQADK